MAAPPPPRESPTSEPPALPILPIESPLPNLTVLPSSTVDRPDEQAGYQVHVIYALPADGLDRHRDTDGEIQRSVSAWEAFFAAQTGGLRLRLDTAQGGALDVTFVRLSRTDASIATHGAYVRDAIQGELTNFGFTDPNKLYAVYYEGSSTFACGGGAYPPSLPGHVAAVYLQGAPLGAPPCSSNAVGANPSVPGYIDISMLHVILHTLGFVAGCAPHHTQIAGGSSGYIGNDPSDLMYGGKEPWNPSHMDPNHTDYFGNGSSGCLDLANSAFIAPLPNQAEAAPAWNLTPPPYQASPGCSEPAGSKTAGPGPRWQAAMAFDEARRVAVLFGGTNSFGPYQQGTDLGDTWTWNGAWQRMVPTTRPAPRRAAGMAYDPANRQVVMFGGVSTLTNVAGETWTWDGTNWTLRRPRHAPPPRSEASLSFDAKLGKIVMFGGISPASGYVTDTWSWDGADWSQDSNPPPGAFSAMRSDAGGYDPATQQFIAIGTDSIGNPTTWAFDGNGWLQVQTGASPGTGFGAMAAPASTGELHFYEYLTGREWAWSRIGWLLLPASVCDPPTRRLAAFSSDGSGRLGGGLLFGGLSLDARTGYDDLWDHRNAGWVKLAS